MRLARHAAISAICLLVVTQSVPVATAPAQPAVPLYRQFLSAPSPLDVVAAKKVDRVAFIAFEEGKRNAYTAVAPAFTPVRLTSFLKDDGIDMSGIRISDDGSTVAFVRGTAPNREGWVANPTADPNGPERSIWAARTGGGVAWRVAEGASPELAPDGSSVLFLKDGQIYRAKVTPVRQPREMDRGEKAFITEWGVQSAPHWSPDGRKIAFVTTRTDHSFIAVYDVATRSVKYLSPSVDFDASPLWSADGRTIVFVRRPGLPFGQQAQQGTGGLGLANGPAFQAAQGRGGRGQAAPQASPIPPAAQQIAGLTRSTFKGGYTLSLWKADVATGEAQEVWHNEPNDRLFSAFTNLRLAGDYVVFPLPAFGGRGGRGRGDQTGAPPSPPPAGPQDEWDRYYSLNIATASSKPVLLTTTDGLIEDQTSVAISADHKTFFYCTNAKDIERRHIWAVPVAGGTPWQVTTGNGIETMPAPLASGKALATLSADWKMPQSLGVWKLASAEAQSAAAQKIVFPTARKGFPMDAHVEPQLVLTKAADGMEIHNQLFLPKDIKPGERRPAIVFVHGGPVRQMLLGYHYMQFYHWAYGINQWLANQGYVVMSINYRSGVRLRPLVPCRAEYRSRRQRGIPGRSRRRQVPADARRRRSEPHRHLGPLVRRRAHVAGARPQLRHLQGGRRSRWRPPLGQLARSRVGLLQVVNHRRHRRLEIPGAARPRRRRSERRVPTDDRPRAAAAATRRVLRADRVPGRHTRVHAAQPLDVHAGPDGNVLQQVPRRAGRADHDDREVVLRGAQGC